MTAPHLDDEQLSLLLDGLDVSARAHVEDEACTACADRLAALRAARDAVAGAGVAPLPAEVLDRLVGRALDAPAAAEVVPLAAAGGRRRRLTAPPPAWLLGAAAGLAALVGVAGLLRAVDVSSGGDDAGSLATGLANDEGESVADEDVAAASGAATGGGGAGPVDPEVVTADLADQDDPEALTLALGALTMPTAAQPAASTFSAARGSAPAGGGATDAASESSGAPAAPTTTAPADRARCRAQAEAAGAGRFAGLLSTATLRWRGEAAEVLVFRLAEPATTADRQVTRQALVLSRPGCTLLADPRF